MTASFQGMRDSRNSSVRWPSAIGARRNTKFRYFKHTEILYTALPVRTALYDLTSFFKSCANEKAYFLISKILFFFAFFPKALSQPFAKLRYSALFPNLLLVLWQPFLYHSLRDRTVTNDHSPARSENKAISSSLSKVKLSVPSPETTASASADFFACSSMIFSSMVLRATRRSTFTVFFCPMR